MSTANPCLRCGACCAFYRVSFYWAEGEDATPGGVPLELTEKLNGFFCALSGTNQKQPRCAALEGAIGAGTRCAIYSRRPTPCRELQASWSQGEANERCDKARAAWGLPPLTRADWRTGSELAHEP